MAQASLNVCNISPVLRNSGKSLQHSVLGVMSKLFEVSEAKSLTDTELPALHSKPHLQCTEMPDQPSGGKPLTRIASERATTPLAFTDDAYSPSNTLNTDKAESDGKTQTDALVAHQHCLAAAALIQLDTDST